MRPHQEGLYRELRVEVDVVLVSSAILPKGDFFEGAGQSLVSRLSILRLIDGLLSGIFVRMRLDVRSLWRCDVGHFRLLNAYLVVLAGLSY